MNLQFNNFSLTGPIGPSGTDGASIGTVISYLGKTAPEGYLICDGAEYQINNYSQLAQFIKDQYGSANYFGGDGINGFCVPDLRNLFLRGYHGQAEELLSGEIGEKQDATEIPYFEMYKPSAVAKSVVATYCAENLPVFPQNQDKLIGKNQTQLYANLINDTIMKKDNAKSYTARPVNMAVLYYIKAFNINNIDEYDTEDGWHVRKWANGYIEQTMKKVYPGLNITTSWGGGYNSGNNFGPFTYPESFTELYGINISGVGSSSVLVTISWSDYYASRFTKTPIIGTYRPAPDTNIIFYIYVFANGRWK